MGKVTFSMMLRSGKRLKYWKMNPIRSLRRLVSSVSDMSPIRVPLMKMSPVVGVSRQPIRFRRVDLPEPEGPMTEMNSPRFTWNETPSSAVTSPAGSG